jgi:glycosyltransferase involved in cell wall biosynthesis
VRPSERNFAIRWLFATSLSEDDLAAARCDAVDPGRGGSPLRLITVTRDVDARATRRLLEALGILSAEWPQVVLDVVGDGPAAPECRRIAEELGVGERVTFHGSVSRERLRSLLGEAALLCLVEDETEGSRQGLHEALASGLPVIAARTAAPPGLLEGCGTVVPAAARAFADAVRDCLADEAHRRQLSATALRVARCHSRERWCEAVRSALEAAWGPLGTAERPGRRAARRTSEVLR